MSNDVSPKALAVLADNTALLSRLVALAEEGEQLLQEHQVKQLRATRMVTAVWALSFLLSVAVLVSR